MSSLQLRYDGGGDGLVAKWSSKEKIKTAAGALVVCLNVGVDPPGIVRISPCPRRHCWVDPLAPPMQRAIETIGKNLQTQYERWQPRAKYKLALDPTVEQLRRVCMSLRRSAKSERVLFHYNGHGVPKPTSNGEIWVFNSQFTQYIPLSMYDLQCWLGNPVIYILDCPSAGMFVEVVVQSIARGLQGGGTPFLSQDGDPMKGAILMGSCRSEEDLDTHPDYPADLFTSCLTTPIKVALRWLYDRSAVVKSHLTLDLLESVPGLPQERKSPLGELHWIFTAVTDSIAWEVLPSQLFQKLFRQDLLVASVFRNFLLAERIMSSMGVMPVSYPRLPPTYNHHLWQTWDVAAERVLLQLPDLLLSKPPREFRFTSFFSEQLDAFALSLKFGSKKKAPPQQLPVLLQVLLSPVHRVRALELLYEFLELGEWAVELSLSVGVFPYVLKLLQTTAAELQRTLISIWAKLLALDTSCQTDLRKDNGHEYFLHYLEKEDGALDLKAKAAAAVALICQHYPHAQKLCLDGQILRKCAKLLTQPEPDCDCEDSWEMLKWVCLCVAAVCEGRPEAVHLASGHRLPEALLNLASAQDAGLRASVVAALSAFVIVGHAEADLQQIDLYLFEHLSSFAAKLVYDGSPIVRRETIDLLSRLVSKSAHDPAFESAMSQIQKDTEVQISGLQRHTVPANTVNKAGHFLSLPTDESSPQRDEILRWTTHDAAQAQLQSFSLEDRAASDVYTGAPIDVHRHIVENLCTLALDPVHEVAALALEELHALHWDMEFWPQRSSTYQPSRSLTETEIQEPFFGRAVPIVRMRSKSRASQNSAGRTSAELSTASGGAEQTDFQEQGQILQTRIELASKYCQRRPFKLKRLHKAKERIAGAPATLREAHSFSSRISGARTHSGSPFAGPSTQGTIGVKWQPTVRIFDRCRAELARSHIARPEGFSEEVKQEVVKAAELTEIKATTINSRVLNLRTDAESIGCILLDPVRPFVAVSDREGHLYVHNYSRPAHPALATLKLSDTHETSVPDSSDTVALFSLEASQSLDRLMACSTDGTVRVWTECTTSDAHLVSAWHAVPVCMAPSFVLAPACFDWQPETQHLFSAGLSLPGIVQQMDMESELLIQQFAVDKSSRPAIDFLKCFRASPNLLSVGTADGMVRVFDVRSHHFVCGTRPFAAQGPISAMTPVQTPRGEALCVLSYGGIMKTLEISHPEDSVFSSLSATSQIRAHSLGCTSALTAHALQPIVVSATLHPVIKVWSADNEHISAIRPLRKYRENCQQAVTSVSFHPTDWRRFAAGGKGCVCGIYDLVGRGQ